MRSSERVAISKAKAPMAINVAIKKPLQGVSRELAMSTGKIMVRYVPTKLSSISRNGITAVVATVSRLTARTNPNRFSA